MSVGSRMWCKCGHSFTVHSRISGDCLACVGPTALCLTFELARTAPNPRHSVRVRKPELTSLDEKVIDQIILGRDELEIAERLNTTPEFVRCYLQILFRKTRTKTRVDLALFRIAGPIRRKPKVRGITIRRAGTTDAPLNATVLHETIRVQR